ncbi:hypothetical protein GCM10027270_35600 [Nocardioides ginkgobilobae]
MNDMVSRLYDEFAVGGYSRVDTTVDFYSRISALLKSDTRVLDLGAGRGAFNDEEPSYRQSLQRLRGRCAHIVGVDVDSAVLNNPGLDESFVVGPRDAWPLATDSIDLLIADWTFEHIEDVDLLSREAQRVVRSGGWICARTPNRRSYIATASRLTPSGLQSAVLRRVQPRRLSVDVFPTHYRLNTPDSVRQAFPGFDLHVCPAFGEPAYFGDSAFAWRFMQGVHRILPNAFAPIFFFFLRKH